ESRFFPLTVACGSAASHIKTRKQFPASIRRELLAITQTGRLIMKDMMKYKDYYGSVHFDDNELILFGKLEFIRALITYEATDTKQLRKAFEEAVDDYLETCQANNISPETPFKGSLNVRLGSDLHRQIAIAATQQHMTVNRFITETLAKAVQDDDFNLAFR
ncbi:MAG: type II toxin-antitoxin system HicB family antitoxin, partial [Gammaproteobacteria bacterium]